MSEEATGTTAVSSSPGRGHPEASGSSPPVKKSAMAQLIGEIFKTQVGKKPTLQLVKEEVAAYKALDCISLDSNPLVWWGTNESTYPRIAKLESALAADSVDKLIFLTKNMKVE